MTINAELYRGGHYGKGFDGTERFLTVQQIMHGTGMLGTFPFIHIGLPQVILPRFDAAAVLEAAVRNRATTTFMVPGMVTRLADAAASAGATLPQAGGLRRIIYGGAPIAADDLTRAVSSSRWSVFLPHVRGRPGPHGHPRRDRPRSHRKVGGRSPRNSGAGRRGLTSPLERIVRAARLACIVPGTCLHGQAPGRQAGQDGRFHRRQRPETPVDLTGHHGVLAEASLTSTDEIERKNVMLHPGTSGHVAAVLAKAEAGGVRGAELAALRRRLRQLGEQQGVLPGEVLEPLADPPRLQELPEPSPGQAREVLDQLVVVKLNGGLGTSMGLSGPKSLLEVKPGASFLDVLARQVLALRERHGARLPLVLMNSAVTRDPSLEALRRHGDLSVPGVPLDFLQGREPKIRADDLQPVAWPADPQLEWCPPGHGDIYAALAASGTLDALLGAGLRYAFVSNSDNLGALADARIAAWMAAERVPFALEAVRGTPADRKGGHLARYRDRLVLRETAQVPDGDDSFTDIERWRWYNTNNIWIDLRALQDLQAADPAAPELPLIVNRKTVDPRDPESTPVIQLESAMGAAIGSIPAVRVVHVPRSRFVPVKTTNDLLVVRSDAYELTGDGQMRATFDGPPPVVTLDKDFYQLLPDFEARFPAGPPSLRRCRRLEVDGDVTFGAGVTPIGDVRVTGSRRVPGSADETITWPAA